VAPLKVNGKLITDSKQMANALNEQFQSVFTEDDGTDIPPATCSIPPMPPIHIHTPGVQKLLNDLNTYKAMGPDNISPRAKRIG
jgi:hypothetical protein